MAKEKILENMHLKVVIVEDSNQDFELICERLADAGYTLSASRAERKNELVALLYADKYDIILSDFKLPEFDAFSALQICIGICPDVPFICVSGSIGEETAIELLKMGAIDYVLKDRPERLPFAIKRALEEAKEKKAHQEAAKALHESEYRFKQVAEEAQEWIWEVDSNGLYTYASPVIKSLLGYSSEELVGQKYFYDFFTNDIKDKFKKAALEVFSKKESFRKFENPNVHKDGHIVILSTSGSPILDNEGNLVGYRGVDADITEQKMAEKDLRTSEEKFRNLFENHSAVKLIIDPQNGNIVDANRAALLFYGYSKTEMLGMKIFQINISPSDILKEEMSKVLRLNKTHFEFKHKKADGSVVDVEVFSSKIEIGGREYLHSIIHDISEKRKAEEQIKLLSRAIEQSSVSIMITDPEGNILYTNPYFNKLTGFTYDEAKGKKPRFLKSGHQSKEFYADLWATILSGSDWEGELQNKKKNGELYWEKAVISPIINRDGKITNFVAIKEDITEKKRIFEELLSAKEKAEESDQLKTAFLNNISHEIRTPLNAIVGFSSILGNPELDDAKRREFIEIISKSNDQLLSVISGIISLATVEAGQEKSIEKETDINEILESVYNQFSLTQFPSEVAFSFHPALPDELSFVYTDPVKLMQILVNLVGNALKFTNEGIVRFGYNLIDMKLNFFVEDSGIGIAEDMHELVFKRFMQVDNTATRKYGGTGLGLALSKSYVELLGGQIHMTSTPGKGSVFSFSIPYKPVERIMPKTMDDSKSFEKSQPQAKTILVAEDEFNNFILIREILVNIGFTVLHASNGIEAIEKCSGDSIPNLVLMDIKMPGIDGVETALRIREKHKEIPIVALTAYTLEEDKSRILASGINDYLEKPIQLKRLNEVLLKYIM